jgi:sulfur-oxidizing protein SoxY
MQRRHLLQGAAGALPLAALGLAGLPRPVRAAWPERAFHDQDLAAVEADLFGDRTPQDSDAVVITAPEIAENGRVVPVEVSIDLPAPRTLTLLSDANPYPLLARAHFTPAVEPRVSLRVKLGESANLIALVEADDGLYRAARAVKVTAGGCGG